VGERDTIHEKEKGQGEEKGGADGGFFLGELGF